MNIILKQIIFLLCCLFWVSSPGLYADNAPVTMAGNVTNATPGTSSVPVPVTVASFSEIGAFTLTIKFDTTRIRFVSATPNPLLQFMSVTYNKPVGNTRGTLVFSWTGSSNISLPDGSSLADLAFSYVAGTGMLNWSYSYGSVCQYKRYVGATLTTLSDSPKYSFYLNGGISNRGAPVTYAPLITPAVAGPVQLPIIINGFTGIGALTLNLEYNPSIIAYQNSFTKNPSFGSSFQVGNVSGTNGNMLIIIQWYGGAVSLQNGATLCTLNFNYIAANGTTPLSWFDNISSCEFADGSGDVLIDLPKNTYYHDGVVAPPLIANFSADNLTPQKNETVQFTDLSTGGATSWNWSFNRPGVVFLNGTTSSSQNPQVCFTDGGLYSVTLQASSFYVSDSEEKPGYVRAGIPGSWTGIASSDWNTESNWDNYLIPDISTAVTIPPAAINWPVFDGDLTIGINCSSLTLSGAASQMTVTGNLTIP